MKPAEALAVTAFQLGVLPSLQVLSKSMAS